MAFTGISSLHTILHRRSIHNLIINFNNEESEDEIGEDTETEEPRTTASCKTTEFLELPRPIPPLPHKFICRQRTNLRNINITSLSLEEAIYIIYRISTIDSIK